LHWLIAGAAGPLTGGGIATHIDFMAIVRELAMTEAFVYSRLSAFPTREGPPPVRRRALDAR